MIGWHRVHIKKLLMQMSLQFIEKKQPQLSMNIFSLILRKYTNVFIIIIQKKCGGYEGKKENARLRVF